MKDKLVNCLEKVKGKVKGISKPFKIILIVWVGLLLLLILSYFVAWATLIMADKAGLADLLPLIKEMTSTAMLAAISLMCAFFVDNDHDGIPDKFNSEVKKND